MHMWFSSLCMREYLSVNLYSHSCVYRTVGISMCSHYPEKLPVDLFLPLPSPHSSPTPRWHMIGSPGCFSASPQLVTTHAKTEGTTTAWRSCVLLPPPVSWLAEFPLLWVLLRGGSSPMAPPPPAELSSPSNNRIVTILGLGENCLS